ncbi:MAG: hypothetical protein P2A85_08185 [Microcoleus anatoxicus]|uniref:hypothetical protein n=1 Tax=Microcoleus anatoxicus TaxID=2705319 RepID=UPI00366DFEFB
MHLPIALLHKLQIIDRPFLGDFLFRAIETVQNNYQTSISKSNSSSSNSAGQPSSKNESENYSENQQQWDSEYKADTYTTKSNSNESHKFTKMFQESVKIGDRTDINNLSLFPSG